MSITLSQPSAIQENQLNKSCVDVDKESSFMSSLSRKLSRSLTLENGGEIEPEHLTPREDPVENWEKWIAINKVSPESRSNQVGTLRFQKLLKSYYPHKLRSDLVNQKTRLLFQI